jgi:hypothetical protein
MLQLRCQNMSYCNPLLEQAQTLQQGNFRKLRLSALSKIDGGELYSIEQNTQFQHICSQHCYND